VVTSDGIVERVRALCPLVRAEAPRAERKRRVTREALDAITGAGVFRMNVPRRYGGYQTPLATQVEVFAELAEACGSAGWATLLQAGCSYIAALFPDEAQDEIFTSPDVRVSGTLIPDATAVPRDGGYVVDGTSAFATGCLDADWHLLTARVEHADGPPEPLWAAIPMAELETLDDWRVSGLAGSGSNSVVAREVFVPEHRVLPVGPLLGGVFPSRANAGDPYYRKPVLLLFCAWAAPEAVGLARAAMADFSARIHKRGITFTGYQRQHEAPVTHLQAADAALRIECAELLTGRMVDLIESKAASGEAYTVEERARIRAYSGYLTRLCKEAVDLLGSAGGASSIREDAVIQRVVRDINALSLHSFVNPATNLELYGRVLAGLDPDTPFL
jgi:alkylation response protein AidB-like acyl-CoA dehydrogenase